MTSGIYKLTFGGKYIYIGKSNDIERRWKEHWDKFASGKAAKNMQQAFSLYGYPSREVIFRCHEDHLDIVEPYFIAINRGDTMLNGVFPSIKEQYEYDYMFVPGDLLNFSTAIHCKVLVDKQNEISQLNEEIESLKSGTVVPKLEEELAQVKQLLNQKILECNKLKNRGFFDWLFNL